MNLERGHIEFFQKKLILPGLEFILKHTTDDFTYSGEEHLKEAKGGILFIGNHLNILFDAMLTSYVLNKLGLKTAHAGAGDNLYKYRLGKMFMDYSGCFPVPREGAGKTAIISLSQHIEDLLSAGEYVWAAQREGRAKNGRHETEEKVLKMLRLASRMKSAAYSQTHMIIPTSISYEIIPDAERMVIQLVTGMKKSHGDFFNDDSLSMLSGVFGRKGRIHLHFSEPVVDNFKDDAEMAGTIDTRIKTNYRHWPSTNAAYYARNMGREAAEALLIPGTSLQDKERVQKFFANIPRFRKHQELREQLVNAYLELYSGPLGH